MSSARPQTALGSVHANTASSSMGRAATAAAGMSRKEARRITEAKAKVIPGEFFYKSFDKQLGEKCGLVTWTHRKEMRKIHCDQIRWSKSYVMLDVQRHQARVARTRKIWFQPERDARVKERAERKIARENEELLESIKKRLGEDSHITLAAKPDWTLRHKHFKKTRKKLQRIAEAEKMKYLNRDNMDLLNLINGAQAYYDPQDWKESFRRHKRLKKAMRKVDDPKKKKKSRAERDALRLRKPEKLKTRRETLLGELYNHALSPKFVETYCDNVEPGVGESKMDAMTGKKGSEPFAMNKPVKQKSTPSRLDFPTSGMSWGSSLLLSSAALGLQSSLNSRGGGGAFNIASWRGNSSGSNRDLTDVDDENWNEEEQAQLMVMFPENMSLGGLDVVVGVWRAREANLALRIRLEDPKTGSQRTVYLSHEAMRRMCKRYPQLLDDTFSQVRAGADNKRNKGGRMKSLLLLLDLSGAFKREIDMMRAPSPSVMRLRSQTALGRSRSRLDKRFAPGTAAPSTHNGGSGNLITSLDQQHKYQQREMMRPSTSAM